MSDSDSSTVLIDKDADREPTKDTSKTPETIKTVFDVIIIGCWTCRIYSWYLLFKSKT